jgi:hypothetical protein
VVWLAWTAASTLGLYLGVRAFFGIVESVALPLPRGPWSDTFNTGALAAGAGAAVGMCQVVVLARRIGLRGAVGWILFTAAGAGLAMATARGGDGLFQFVGAGPWFCAVQPWVWRSVAAALLGGTVGLGQCLVLRQGFGRALWWVPGCVVGTLATPGSR